MRRPWQVWLAFAFCLLIAVASVGWISAKAIDISRRESQARSDAKLEEHTRLALWRIDSAMAPILARESARSVFAYSPFYPLSGAIDKLPDPLADPSGLAASPLLSELPFHARLYFQIDEHRRMTSPEIPVGPNRNAAVPFYVTADKIQRAERDLERLQELTTPEELFEVVQWQRPGNRSAVAMSELPSSEFSQRSKIFSPGPDIAGPDGGPHADLQTAVMTPLWIENELFLFRRVRLGKSELVQGCWLDWPAIQGRLLDLIKDLLPAARLEAFSSLRRPEDARLLAALPVELLPGRIAAPPEPAWSPLRVALAATWVLLALTAMAVGALLQGVLALSERRAAFVSAVTHELRTPLTTFRLYAELLAGNMAPSEAARQKYLRTLQVEADRLMHLVENVLSYARIERGRPGGRIAPVSVDALLNQAAERMADRAEQADYRLLVEADDAARHHTALADAAAVEQILFNLVDNACKYARSEVDRRIHVTVARENGQVVLRVRDHGPGISAHERARLFQPFRKSASEAAQTAPGVGLGLALCRRLARAMHGDLRYEGDQEGACFALVLPAAPAQTAAPRSAPADQIVAPHPPESGSVLQD